MAEGTIKWFKSDFQFCYGFSEPVEESFVIGPNLEA